MPLLTVIAITCFFVYLITLLARIVKALEHIAEKTGKTAQMLERMVDKLESAGSNLPPAE